MTHDISMPRNATNESCPWWKLASVHWNLGGSIACLVVFVAIVYVYRFGAIEQSVVVLPNVGAEEAIEVLRHADTWRQVHDESRVAYLQKLERVESLAIWIPDTVDFDALNQQIRQLAVQNNAQLILLDRERTLTGSRVGVMVCTCHIRGSFASICHVLDELPKMERPVNCDGIVLKHRSNDAATSMWCDAIISLRAPYAADSTLAAQLMAQRGNHGG